MCVRGAHEDGYQMPQPARSIVALADAPHQEASEGREDSGDEDVMAAVDSPGVEGVNGRLEGGVRERSGEVRVCIRERHEPIQNSLEASRVYGGVVPARTVTIASSATTDALVLLLRARLLLLLLRQRLNLPPCNNLTTDATVTVAVGRMRLLQLQLSAADNIAYTAATVTVIFLLRHVLHARAAHAVHAASIHGVRSGDPFAATSPQDDGLEREALTGQLYAEAALERPEDRPMVVCRIILLLTGRWNPAAYRAT